MKNIVSTGVGVTAALTLCLAAQAGETCATATPVGLGTTAIFIGATTDNNPGATCNTFSANDVFFTFTPATTGAFNFNTCGASASGWFDTVLSVYSGTCGATTQLGCNDDNGSAACGPNGWSSSINGLALTAGVTYLIRVADYDGASFGDGNGFLTIAGGTPPPPGETCAAAVNVGLGSTPFNTTGMTNDGTTNCGGSGPDVFFRFTPASSGAHVFSLCGSTFDTTLGIRTDDCSTEIACDDDSCAPASTVTVNLTAGVPVRIEVDGFGGASGSGTLTISDNVPLGIAGGFSTGPELSQVFVGAFVTPGNPPPSTGIIVTADLSSIGGSSTQQLFDSGPPVDEVAGDNVYEYLYTLPASVLTGTYTYPISVVDDQARTASATSQLDVTDGPSGACCTAGSCAISRETICAPGGGTWIGAGTNCGGPGYSSQVAGAGNDFLSIAGTGTMLATASGCDDCTETFALPFAFNFYGSPVTNVSVSSNGNLQFDAATPNGAYTNTSLPNAGSPLNAIFPAWDDYNPGVQGDVYYQVFGSSPSQSLKISWEGVTEFGATNNNNFQVTLFEGSDSFIVAYGNMDNMPEAFAGDITVGTQDAAGSSATQQPTSAVGDDTETEWNYGVAPSPCGPSCDSIDWNNDQLFPDTLDIDDFLSVFSGGPCSNDPNCGDIDFNNDGLFPDTLDIDALLSVFSGGPCLV